MFLGGRRRDASIGVWEDVFDFWLRLKSGLLHEMGGFLETKTCFVNLNLGSEPKPMFRAVKTDI